jgi:hypothetical protein
MNNERARPRAAFRFKDPTDRVGIERIGSKSVYGLGGEGDKTALADQLSCALYFGVCR